MKVMLVSSDDNFIAQTRRVLDAEVQLIVCHEVEQSDFLPVGPDIFILDLDEEKVIRKDFKAILDIKCLSEAPILVRVEKAKILDVLEVLALGALDIMENPVKDDEYRKKVKEFYKWGWYFSWLKKQNLYDNETNRQSFKKPSK